MPMEAVMEMAAGSAEVVAEARSLALESGGGLVGNLVEAFEVAAAAADPPAATPDLGRPGTTEQQEAGRGGGGQVLTLVVEAPARSLRREIALRHGRECKLAAVPQRVCVARSPPPRAMQ
jgi:hypothetical protein